MTPNPLAAQRDGLHLSFSRWVCRICPGRMLSGGIILRMKAQADNATPLYGRYLIRLVRPFPDFDFPFIRQVRRRAVELLRLEQGDRVLDAGCGPGGSFPYLVRAVGPSGQVTGVELSPEIIQNARRRIEKNGWRNVNAVEGSAQDVRLSGVFDGLLMCAAPDVYASKEALDNMWPHLRDGARVVVFGAKISNKGIGRVLNPMLRLLLSRLSFPTTPKPDEEPWRLLSPRVDRIEIEEYLFGCMFLASGSAIGSRAKIREELVPAG